MLIDVWEKVRGYDRWVPVGATIESSEMKDSVVEGRGGPSHLYTSADRLVWFDGNGNRHTGECKIPSDSSLYQLVGGEKVSIRYNPTDPGEFYFPELLKARIYNNAVGVLTLFLFLALIVLPILVFMHVIKIRM